MKNALENLRAQVMFNCHVSDAKYGGVFSLCGFLLRMRDYYKWEKNLNPWDEPDYSELLAWVEDREKLWETTSREEFRSIELNGHSFDPFDVEAINAAISPHSLLYGAGYATGMKPTFFLATVKSLQRVKRMDIHILDRELARDIFTSPAMRQGRHIITRPWAMAALIWDLILEQKPSTAEVLKYSLADFDLDLDRLLHSPALLAKDLWRLSRHESETWVYHELGEALQKEFQLELWQEIIASYSNTVVEKAARAVKDILADTHEQGLLAHIITQRKIGSLGFYLCLIPPMSRAIFPEISTAFERIRTAKDWNFLEEARHRGYQRARVMAAKLTGYHLEGRTRGPDWVRSRVETELINPLG